MGERGEMALQRWRASIAFRCRWRDQAIDGKTVNLSYGGACLRHPVVAPPPGENIYLTLTLHGLEVGLPATVVYQRLDSDYPGMPAVFGVRFQESAEELTHKLGPVLHELALP